MECVEWTTEDQYPTPLTSINREITNERSNIQTNTTHQSLLCSPTLTMKHHHLPDIFKRNDSASVCSVRSTNCLSDSKQRSWSLFDHPAPGDMSLLDHPAPGDMRFEDVFRVDFRRPCTPPDPPCTTESALDEVWSHCSKKKMLNFAQAVRCVTNIKRLAKRATTSYDTSEKKPSNIKENTGNARFTTHQQKSSFTTYRHPLCGDTNRILNIAPPKTSKDNDMRSLEKNDVQNSKTITHLPELPLSKVGICEKTKNKDHGWKRGCLIDDPRGCIEEAILKRRGYCPTNPYLGSKLRKNKLLKSLSCDSMLVVQR